MSLSAGEKLGPYEILAPIGKGGMGEVYKARDTRLDRIVAIKVSKTEFSERFEREARAVAALNHPNICTLHDVGPNYLVMEYVEGTPLKGPLPLEQALKYAVQICDALDAAHKKNITHRDLKPANILITKQGIKLLDFGLAKLGSAGTGQAAKPPDDATLTMALTGRNEIVGTLYYMSPEQLQAQANGREIDARSDIFSFGLVLYEMLTGKRAFEGSSPASVIAAIMERPAPSITDVAPAALDRVLKTCLVKDPDERWQTARDLKRELEWIASASGEVTTVPTAVARYSLLLWIVAAVLFLVTTLGVSFVHLREKPPAPPELTQFQVFPPERSGATPHVLISPDGRQVLFTGVGPDGRERLWVRNLDSLEARPLPGTEGPASPSANPFWSPDSRYVAFSVDGKLKKILASGGPPQLLCDTADGDTGGGSWNQDGVILFGSQSHGLYRVSAAGGVATPVTALDPSRQEEYHRRPVFLPDGRHFLYVRSSVVPDNSGIYLGSLDAKSNEQSRKRLLSGQIGVVYAPTADPAFGSILFLQEGTLMAQSFDTKKGELTAEPVPIAEQVGSNGATTGYFSASTNGSLAYRSEAGVASRPTWFDRQGKALGSIGDPGEYGSVALSPDGKRIAASRLDARNWDIWLFDVARNAGTRLTFDPGFDDNPIWSRDGKQIAFMRFPDLFRKPSDGAGSEELLLKSGEAKRPMDWSPEGALLFTNLSAQTRLDLLFLPVDGNRKPTRYLATQFTESAAQFSPDGRWVVYRSNESGRNEIYVRPFPNASGGKWMVSSGGGAQPRWRRDGREILYVSSDGRLMSVEVSVSGSMFRSSAPKPLFVVNARVGVPESRWKWDVTADGQRFLIITEPDTANAAPITVVMNWYRSSSPQSR